MVYYFGKTNYTTLREYRTTHSTNTTVTNWFFNFLLVEKNSSGPFQTVLYALLVSVPSTNPAVSGAARGFSNRVSLNGNFPTPDEAENLRGF